MGLPGWVIRVEFAELKNSRDKESLSAAAKEKGWGGFCKLCMRLAEWNLRKFLCDARSSNPFRQLAFLATKTVLAKVPRVDDGGFPRPAAYIRRRSLVLRSREDFILFLVLSVSPFTTGTRPVREKCSDVKRRLLRSIFARCTFLNAKRARGNSWDFIALSFLHGLCIFTRLRKLLACWNI